MSFDYLSLQVTANRLIEQFGQTATISRQAASGATPWAPTLTETGYEVKAVMLDYSAREIDATDILGADQKAYVAVGQLPITPKAGDTMTVGSIKLEVVRSMPLGPAGVAVFFELQLRK